MSHSNVKRLRMVEGAGKRSLEGKVALVTGASSGMGLATVVGLLKQRAHVVATCRCASPVSLTSPAR